MTEAEPIRQEQSDRFQTTFLQIHDHDDAFWNP